MYKIVTLLSFLLLMNFTSLGKGTEIVKGELTDLSNALEYYLDTTGVYTFETISKLPSTKFSSTKEFIFNKNTVATIWVRFTVDTLYNNTSLLFNNSTMDSIVFFDGGGYQYQGELVHANDKLHNTILPIFSLPNTTGPKSYYLKISNPYKLSILDIKIGENGAIYRKANVRVIVMAGFFFLLFVVLMLNLILYIFIKSSMVLYVGLFNFTTLLFVAIYSGLDTFLPYDIAFKINPYATLFLCLLMLSGIIMSINLLSIKRLFPITYKILVGFFILIGILALLVLIGKWEVLATAIAGPLGGIIIPIYIITSYRAYKMGQSHALYFLIGWIVYYVVMITIILMIFNLIPVGEYTNYLTPSVSVIDFFLIMATVISKINRYRIEKEQAEKEHLDLIENQKDVLEEAVIERTRELQILNEEVATQNEELHSQKEQIFVLYESLEKKVEQRTFELQSTLSSLQIRNKDLENFSYVVSHNLRGPVSTMLGLVQIFNTENLADPSNLNVIQYTKRSVESLDRVIKDLNYVISVRKSGDEEDYSDVVLSKELNLSLVLLEKEITAAHAKVESDFSTIDTLHSVPAYLQNIFYNLISNSIKYKKENEAPLIKIKSSIENGNVLLSFTDNGIGMDMSVITPEKMFKMFQRFNSSTEGRGLGLYLVKSQVDMLKGSIEVKSAIGVGTEFIIWIPIEE